MWTSWRCAARAAALGIAAALVPWRVGGSFRQSAGVERRVAATFVRYVAAGHAVFPVHDMG
jgi:hypothetical protein